MLSDRVTAWIIAGSLLGLALVLLFRGGLSSVSAAPVAPHIVFGQAKTQDETVLDSGLAIEARINNVNYAQTIDVATGIGSQSVTTHSQDDSGLNYGTQVNFQVCADDPGSGALEGGKNGQAIFFFVSGIQAQVQVGSALVNSLSFTTGNATQVDLVIPSLTEPIATPATASDDACTTAKAPSAPTAIPTAIPAATPRRVIPTMGGTGQVIGAGAFVPSADETPTPTPIAVSQVEEAALEEAVQVVEEATI